MMENVQKDFGFCPSPAAAGMIAVDRGEIRDVLSGKEGRLLVIVGPCSAWPEDAVLEYAEKLRPVAKAVSDRLKIVMRAYTQKPRTVDGWNGLLVQPDPFSSPDMEEGLRRAAALMERIVLMGLPIADEALFLSPSLALSQWLSWTAIGARSSEDQEHRAYASGIGIPVGIKHPGSGSVAVGINGVVASRSPQFAPLFSRKTFTRGNPFAHLVLRGGETGPNYDAGHIASAVSALRERGVADPAVIVDASHDNVRIDGAKDPTRQIAVIREVLASLLSDGTAREGFRGFMLESFLKPGNQDIRKTGTGGTDRGGLSITDPCLSWEETEDLLREMADTRGKSELVARESH